MSFSDLTRSYTTAPPSFSPSSVALSSSRSSSSLTAAPSAAASSSSAVRPPLSVSLTAARGPSNIAGYSIAAGETALHSAPESSSAAGVAKLSTPEGGAQGVDQGLALGLGLGLGLGTLLTLLGVYFIFRQRRVQKQEFEQRARRIRATVDGIEARRGEEAPTMRET
ncbi:hypothetical protein Rhopal_003946-T1 [Rhodotorula paludigena]|uniref:Uncharacterized protein n=1 Tax=Rhodotorula paludigena TaxID=86838 RepID=A0AAV5GN64_9BASI|nr:hypothetical protein Rhopal_003946-T1 [Rhodotorula paludigena]